MFVVVDFGVDLDVDEVLVVVVYLLVCFKLFKMVEVVMELLYLVIGKVFKWQLGVDYVVG